MDVDLPPLDRRSQSAAAAMLSRLQQLHAGSGRSLDASLAASMPDLQAISDAAKQESLRRQLAAAKAGREAGGVGAERRFDKALGEIDAVDQMWDGAVQASFDRLVQDWVATGGEVLGPGGWIRVTVRPYRRGGIWWTDSELADQWCRTIAADVFTGVVADPRSRSGDTVGLVRLSEPSIGPVIAASVMAMLGDFQDQQRYDAERYGVHPLQSQEAAERIHARRGPLIASCRAELQRLLQDWDAQRRVGPSDRPAH